MAGERRIKLHLFEIAAGVGGRYLMNGKGGKGEIVNIEDFFKLSFSSIKYE